MTIVTFDNQSFLLSGMYLTNRNINNTRVGVFQMNFAKGGGSITYAVPTTALRELKAFQKAVNYIESKLNEDVRELDLTPVFRSLNELGFTSRDSLYEDFKQSGGVVKELRRQSTQHVEGIFLKYVDGETIMYKKIAADEFSISSHGVTTLGGTRFRLFVHGAFDRVFPTIDYFFNARLHYLENEKYIKDGHRAELKAIIKQLASQGAVVDLNQAEEQLRPNISLHTLKQVSTVTVLD